MVSLPFRFIRGFCEAYIYKVDNEKGGKFIFLGASGNIIQKIKEMCYCWNRYEKLFFVGAFLCGNS